MDPNVNTEHCTLLARRLDKVLTVNSLELLPLTSSLPPLTSSLPPLTSSLSPLTSSLPFGLGLAGVPPHFAGAAGGVCEGPGQRAPPAPPQARPRQTPSPKYAHAAGDEAEGPQRSDGVRGAIRGAAGGK
eukprot:1191071-Prorocentrum_minimum.AAC.2